MKPCGIILFVYELFISESKSQDNGILHVFSKWGMEKIGVCTYHVELMFDAVKTNLAFPCDTNISYEY